MSLPQDYINKYRSRFGRDPMPAPTIMPGPRGKPIGFIGPPAQIIYPMPPVVKPVAPPVSTPWPVHRIDPGVIHTVTAPPYRVRPRYRRHRRPMPHEHPRPHPHPRRIAPLPLPAPVQEIVPKPVLPPDVAPMPAPTGRTCPTWGWMVRTNPDGSETVIQCQPGQPAAAGLHGLEGITDTIQGYLGPNWMLYAGLVLGAYFLLKKKM